MTPENLLTVKEAAKALRVDASTVRRWIRAGVLPAISLPKVGKRDMYRIRERDLEELLNTPAPARAMDKESITSEEPHSTVDLPSLWATEDHTPHSE